jgi:hypothetical protein
MRKSRLVAAVLLVSSVGGGAFADTGYWHASSGLLPSDPSIPSEDRFTILRHGEYLTMDDGFMNVSDTGTGSSDDVGLFKSDIPTIPEAGSWAYQTELRINSHSRPILDFGARVGIIDQARWGLIAIASDKVGFEGEKGNSFVNNAYYSLDATDDFHTYRVVKDSGLVELFVDVFDSPVLSLPYSDLHPTSGSEVRLTVTSGQGVADYDVRSFGFNTHGTELPKGVVPEPSQNVLFLGLCVMGLVICGWHRTKRAQN